MSSFLLIKACKEKMWLNLWANGLKNRIPELITFESPVTGQTGQEQAFPQEVSEKNTEDRLLTEGTGLSLLAFSF